MTREAFGRKFSADGAFGMAPLAQVSRLSVGEFLIV